MFERINLNEMKDYTEHLLQLSENDRYMRFAGYVSDDSILNYVSKINHNDIVIGYRDIKCKIIAASHIGIMNNIAEIGISVLEPYRGNGLSRMLWRRSVLFAKENGCKIIVAECLRMNKKMINFARAMGMNITSDGSETHGDKKIPPIDIFDQLMISQHIWGEHYLWCAKILKKIKKLKNT